jgi:hypothetical protein
MASAPNVAAADVVLAPGGAGLKPPIDAIAVRDLGFTVLSKAENPIVESVASVHPT